MGWACAAASSATVLILAYAAAADADTMHLLFGNLLAVSAAMLWPWGALRLTIAVHILFTQRFLLATFDPEAALVAGVNARRWMLLLNVLVGVATATAVQHIGALLHVRSPDAACHGGAAADDQCARRLRDGRRVGNGAAVSGSGGVVLPRPACRARGRCATRGRCSARRYRGSPAAWLKPRSSYVSESAENAARISVNRCDVFAVEFQAPDHVRRPGRTRLRVG